MSDAQAAPPKKSKKLLVVGLVAALVAGGAGAGGWFYLQKSKAGDDADEEVVHAPKKDAKPIFTTLEPFTVNLKDPRGERFAQIGVTLQVGDPKVEAQIKERLPAVRNDILMLISSKQIEDLLTVEGKQKLAAQIRLSTGRALGLDLPDPDEEDEEAEADKPAKGKAEAEEGDEKPKARKKAKKKKKPPENPVTAVLFSQFIVQ